MDLTLIIAVVGIPALVLATWLLGFGKRRQISDEDLERVLQRQDLDARLADRLISEDHASAIGLTADHRLLLVRSMGDDISARLSPISGVSVRRLDGGKPRLRLDIHDAGFPDLTVMCSEADANKWMKLTHDHT